MKNFFTSLLMVYSIFCTGQVGINYTPNGSEEAALIILSKDNKAIGKLNNGQNITPGMILVSDNNGTATWTDTDIFKMPTVNGIFGAPITRDITFPLTQHQPSPVFLSNSYIEIPPGEWAITLQMNVEVVLISRDNETLPYTESNLTREQNVWVRTSLANDGITEAQQNFLTITPDFVMTNLSSGELIGSESEITTKGEMYINNTTTQTKRYNLIVYLEFHAPVSYELNKRGIRLKNFAAGPSSNGVDRFYAIKYR